MSFILKLFMELDKSFLYLFLQLYLSDVGFELIEYLQLILLIHTRNIPYLYLEQRFFLFFRWISHKRSHSILDKVFIVILVQPLHVKRFSFLVNLKGKLRFFRFYFWTRIGTFPYPWAQWYRIITIKILSLSLNTLFFIFIFSLFLSIFNLLLLFIYWCHDHWYFSFERWAVTGTVEFFNRCQETLLFCDLLSFILTFKFLECAYYWTLLFKELLVSVDKCSRFTIKRRSKPGDPFCMPSFSSGSIFKLCILAFVRGAARFGLSRHFWSRSPSS